MKAKKSAMKSVKNIKKQRSQKKPAAKPKTKKVGPAVKAPAKKAAHKKAAVKPKKLLAKSPVKKANSFSIKSAAEKLKSAFAKKPEATKSMLKNPLITAKKPAMAAKVTKAMAQAAKPVAKAAPATKVPVALPAPKGLLTEDRVRRMSDKEYMNDSQLNFFRYRLLQMRNEVLARELDVKERLHQREVFADPADRATAEEEHWLDLRLRERESLLLRKIDDALRRIADREFGYCEKTGDPIGIPRLLARPTATVCVDVKGQDERIESQFRDR